MSEEYSVGYEDGYQKGWNDAMDSMPAQPKENQDHIDQHIEMVEPKREPLTEQQWFDWWRVATVMDNTQAEIDFADFILVARAIEAAHGIKGEA